MLNEKGAEDRALLAGTGFFRDLPAGSLDAIAAGASRLRLARGEIVFTAGEPGESLFVVVSGRVKVYMTNDAATEVLLTTFGPGEVFGEIALLDGGGRSASAAAIDDCELLVLERVDLLRLIRDHPQIADPVLRAVGRIVRRLTERTSDLIFLDLAGRVAKLLLAQTGGTTGVAELGLTQSEVAALVGGSRQAVNQVLRSFQQRGYVSLQGKDIIVRDAAALARRAT